MIQIGDICNVLEAFAPLDLQESYDNSGLIIGSRADEATGVLICLDVTPEVLDEAISLGYNMILSHHPVIFNGLKKLVGANLTEQISIKAIRHHLNIYAGHTNVDVARGGVNDQMAKKLGLKQSTVFMPSRSENDQAYGLGIIGELEKPLSESEFLERVKTTFHCNRIRHSGLKGKTIQKVALCGGSGASLISQAIIQNADAYLTGEAKYNDFLDHADQLLFVDAGHYETEQFTKEIFLDLLSKKFPTFALRISTKETNPVQYF
jgi:dinuclear metal center YbgI/SA1388 family protein